MTGSYMGKPTIRWWQFLLWVVGCLAVCAVFYVSLPKAPEAEDPVQIEYSKDYVKATVEETIQALSQQYARKDSQRDQIMSWTITILVGIVGFAFTREGEQHKKALFVLALVFCTFMHMLDTMVLDWTNRQTVYGAKLHDYLYRWDSMNQDSLQVIRHKVGEGIELNDEFGSKTVFNTKKGILRKAQCLVYAGGFLALWWWGLTIGIASLMWWVCYRKGNTGDDSRANGNGGAAPSGVSADKCVSTGEDGKVAFAKSKPKKKEKII